jgi:anthranilate synthase component 1
MMNSADLTRSKMKMVTVHRVLPGDLETPITAFLKLCPDGPAFLLESAAGGEQAARYSFLGYNPFLTLRGNGTRVELCWRDGQRELKDSGPFKAVRAIMNKFASDRPAGRPRFFGGAVGYIGYDTVFVMEPVGVRPQDELGTPDAYLQFMENTLIFDHITHQLHLLVNRPVRYDENSDQNPETVKKTASDELDQMAEKLSKSLPPPRAETFAPNRAAVSGNMTKEVFMENVLKAKEYIQAGDIFQVVLSQRFTAPVAEDAFTIYRRLRSMNPSPYMFFLRYADLTLVGASPEMLTRVEGKTVTTRPIAGTRKRGRTEREDKLLEEELLADPKERAEHLMLVDLGRNDLGRVARYGTVCVREYAKVERFSHVMHLVSEVCAELAEGKDALDALEACFPAGTLTGAPKVRAMQIINELEGVRRGPYGGAVGYLDFGGNLDSCITIRTMLIKDQSAYIQTGAGVVADSAPEAEYQETLDKAKAVLAALGVSV